MAEKDLAPDARRFEIVTLALVAGAAVCVLLFGLTPLLFGLLGSRAASLGLARSRWGARGGRSAPLIASFLVGAVALGLCGGLAAWGMGSAAKAVKEVPAMAAKLTEQAQRLKDYLPELVAQRIPDEAVEMQEAISELIAGQASGIASAGKTWGAGALFAVIGWIIGLLMANMRTAPRAPGPLTLALRGAGARLADVFERIVVAQFFVACANTLFAAIFMFILLPLAGESMPWAPALLALTLGLSMIPAAGNVICNAVVFVVSLTVGPGVAVSALVYLVAVHKVEYLISAKVLGKRVAISTWELLLIMFAMEAVFGIAGLIAAPLFYVHAKNELIRLGWL